MTDLIAYHEQRAEREMALGLTATSMAAARAHLELATLHREQVRGLAGRLSGSKPPLIMS